jgi:hypothetical protein
MRNDIGSSHPNTYVINSYELLGWLQTCIKEVLQENISESAITVSKIIENIKKIDKPIEQSMKETFSRSLSGVSTYLVGNLLKTLFALFVSQKYDQTINANILTIAQIVWGLVKDDQKYALGISVDGYRTLLDEVKVQQSELFFEKCNGKRYFTKNTRIIKLNNLSDTLLKVHYEWDNFYHEVPVIRELMTFIKSHEDIPLEIQEKVIANILVCRIGREVNYFNGVSPSGKILYDKFIKLLNEKQAILLLSLAIVSDIRCGIYGKNTINNFMEILQILKSPLYGDRTNEIIDYLLSMKEPQNALHVRDFQEIARGIMI